jgi:hypothetical protein
MVVALPPEFEEITMNESGPAAMAPSDPYAVTSIAGHEPTLDDCVGATTVTVKGEDQEFRLRGAGKRDGEAVQFHEKEPASAADETPVWTIIKLSDGHIVAEPPVM